MRPTNKKKELPSWARASFLEDETPSVSLGEEELYLRTRAYHAVSKQLDDALRATMDASMITLVDNLQQFFEQCSPVTGATPDGVVDGCSTGVNTTNQFCVEPPHRYSPTMLPLALLASPSNLLDRRELSMCLTTTFQQTCTRTAVCHLRPLPKSNSANHCGPWVEEIYKQCVHQEGTFSLKRKRGRVSATDRWLDWAQQTIEFDNVVVFLEGDGVSSRILQDFLLLLSSLRAHHGLPVQCILVTSSGTTNQSSSLECQSNTLIQRFSFPKSQTVVDGLYNSLLRSQATASLISPKILATIHDSFQNHHASFVKTLALVKQAIVLHYQQARGSALCLSAKDNDNTDATKRLEWFTLDPYGRKLLTGNHRTTKQSLTRQQDEQQRLSSTLSCVMQALSKLLMSTRDDMPSLMNIEASLLHQGRMRAMTVTIVQEMKKEDTKRILSRLAEARSALSSSEVSEQPPSKKLLLHAEVEIANELIVLMHAYQEEGVVGEDKRYNDVTNHRKANLWKSVEEWVHGLLQLLSTAHSSKASDDALCRILLPEHRRNVAVALNIHGDKINKSTDIHKHEAISTVPSQLFRLMTNQISIERYGWFELYKDWIKKLSLDEEEMWALFSLGIYQLINVGLIREKGAASRGQVVYEKAALVWSTGE
jgi:hypothetical protein